MRILQFVFGIWGFFACRDFSVTLRMDCNDKFTQTYEIEYPFEFSQDICRRRINNQTLLVSLESSSGAQLFALTAALSVLYALFIIFVYAYLDEMYKSKPEFPMAVSWFLLKPKNYGMLKIYTILLGFRFDSIFGFLLDGWNVRFQQRRKCFEEDYQWRLHWKRMHRMCSACREFYGSEHCLCKILRQI